MLPFNIPVKSIWDRDGDPNEAAIGKRPRTSTPGGEEHGSAKRLESEWPGQRSEVRGQDPMLTPERSCFVEAKEAVANILKGWGGPWAAVDL